MEKEGDEMKKITNFMIFIALVSILCLSLPLIIARQAAFPLQDVIGNASALHGVSFDGTVNLEEASILISYDCLLYTSDAADE